MCSRRQEVTASMATTIEYSSLTDNDLKAFSLVWLDTPVNDTHENVDAQQRLRTSTNYFKTFENNDECERYIRSVSPQDQIFLIITNRVNREVVPRIHQLQQVSSIHVYCTHKRNKQWIIQFSKVNNASIDHFMS